MQEQDPAESRWAKRAHWLENVFWYHYKWYYFVGIFAAVLLIASVLSFTTRVTYDWTVPYVHTGEADSAGVSAVKKALTGLATDTSGNGRVQIKVEEYADTEDPGRKDLLGLLRDSNDILYVLDEETLTLYRSLGWFQEAAPLGDGRWLAVNDAPVTPFTLAEYAEYGYTQAQIDESNEYMAAEHAKLVAEAEGIVRSLQK